MNDGVCIRYSCHTRWNLKWRKPHRIAKDLTVNLRSQHHWHYVRGFPSHERDRIFRAFLRRPKQFKWLYRNPQSLYQKKQPTMLDSVRLPAPLPGHRYRNLPPTQPCFRRFRSLLRWSDQHVRHNPSRRNVLDRPLEGKSREHSEDSLAKNQFPLRHPRIVALNQSSQLPYHQGFLVQCLKIPPLPLKHLVLKRRKP